MRTLQIIELEAAIKRERAELKAEQAIIDAIKCSPRALLERDVERRDAIKRSLAVAKADLRRLKANGGTWN